MTFASLIEPLRSVALFQGLRPLQISEIARRADRVIFKPGEAIIGEGSAGDAAYLIVSGKAVRTAGPSADDESEAVGPGTIVGEMAMLVETTYSSTVICQEPIKALKISREDLLEQMGRDIGLADHIIDKLSNRLKRLANDLRKVDQTLAPSADIHPGPLAGAINPILQPVVPEAHH